MFPRKLTKAADQSLKSKSADLNFEFEISDTGYGKDHVRIENTFYFYIFWNKGIFFLLKKVKILHVRREGNIHYIKEFEVNTHLKLYSKKDYLNGNYFPFNFICLRHKCGFCVVAPASDDACWIAFIVII